MLTKEKLLKEYESFYESEKHRVQTMYLDVNKTMEEVGERMEEGWRDCTVLTNSFFSVV